MRLKSYQFGKVTLPHESMLLLTPGLSHGVALGTCSTVGSCNDTHLGVAKLSGIDEHSITVSTASYFCGSGG